MTAPDLLVLDDCDNVATALRDLDRGAVQLSGRQGSQGTLQLRQAIRLGHKAALERIDVGDLVIKHGHPIGRVTASIAQGDHVHVHNVESLSLDDTESERDEP